MSLRLLSQEIDHFLAGDSPGVLCITGKWGVGKTYAWNAMLRAVQARKAIPLPRYSYVSLFGLTSLADVKAAIWENSVDSSLADAAPSIASVEAAFATARSGWRKAMPWLTSVPQLGGYAALSRQALFLTVRKQIVCIDDLERSGRDLGVKDVLGLLSFLKEQRACKVVLLLNEEGLAGDGASDFKTQLEKVADNVIHLDPTPAEAAAIGISAARQSG